MDWIVTLIGLAFTAWAFFRVGHLVGKAEGAWGPAAMKRLTAAREDAYANGVRHGRGLPDAHREHIPDLVNRFPEPAE